MRIFNYNPNKYNQNNEIKLPMSAVPTTQTTPSTNLNYSTNVYFHPAQISFGALKKHEFEGIDLAVVEKFKPPIEKFKSKDDLQNWASEQTKEIANQDFGGRQTETKIQRKAMIKEWADYVLKENGAYNDAAALLILNAITKDLKPDNDNILPVLNKGVIADCISEIDKNIKFDRKYQFDLNKMYETKLRAIYLEDTIIKDGNTGWIKIPSQDNDPENFEANVEKLKTLSHQNWCTKSFNAEPYLSEGDFHIYLENGQPKIGIRFVDDEIQEIQGEKNNNQIPISYFDEVKKHIKDENLKLRDKAKEEREKIQKIEEEINKIKTDLKSAIENKDAKAIFEYFDIDAEEDKDGFLTISEYRYPSDFFDFSDIGIDENMLFERVKVIEGNADFDNSKLTSLYNLKSIGGETVFYNSKITDLANLKTIGGSVYFENSQVTNTGKIKSIDGDAHFNNSKITDLEMLKSIGGSAYFQNSQITNLGNLKTIGGNARFNNSKVTDLGKLETIGGYADFDFSQITDLGNLKTIGGKIYVTNSQLTPNDFKNVKIYGKTV